MEISKLSKNGKVQYPNVIFFKNSTIMTYCPSLSRCQKTCLFAINHNKCHIITIFSVKMKIVMQNCSFPLLLDSNLDICQNKNNISLFWPYSAAREGTSNLNPEMLHLFRKDSTAPDQTIATQTLFCLRVSCLSAAFPLGMFCHLFLCFFRIPFKTLLSLSRVPTRSKGRGS